MWSTFPNVTSAPEQQQQQAAAGTRPGNQVPAPQAAGHQVPTPQAAGQVPASPPWLDAPHLVASLTAYLEALQSPSFVHQPMPLAWGHVILPGGDI
jgi:hypothetical protein